MKVEEDVGEHAQSAAALALVVLHPEHGLVERGLFRLLQRLEIFFGLLAESSQTRADLLDYGRRAFGFRSRVYLVSHQSLPSSWIAPGVELTAGAATARDAVGAVVGEKPKTWAKMNSPLILH